MDASELRRRPTMERKSYIRQYKCCETCRWLNEDGCFKNNAQCELCELDESTGECGVNCADWEHWPLNDDEQEIVRLEAENARLHKFETELELAYQAIKDASPEGYEMVMEGKALPTIYSDVFAENARLRKVVEAARKIASELPESYSVGEPEVGVYHYIANCMDLQSAFAELDSQATEITLEHDGARFVVPVDDLKKALTGMDEGAKGDEVQI
jgi:hypothetical protein